MRIYIYYKRKNVSIQLNTTNIEVVALHFLYKWRVIWKEEEEEEKKGREMIQQQERLNK